MVATPGNRRRMLVVATLATINVWTGQGIISYCEFHSSLEYRSSVACG
jgi:hypothetical protein